VNNNQIALNLNHLLKNPSLIPALKKNENAKDAEIKKRKASWVWMAREQVKFHRKILRVKRNPMVNT